MQKTQWRSRTSSCKFRWLDNSRPQGPKRQLRVSKQSSTRSGGAGSSHPMDPGVSVQNQDFTRNPEKLAKVPGAREEPKVIYTDTFLEFGKACEDLSWNHCTSTPHRSETNGIAERAVRRAKEGTSAVLLQSEKSEWKLVGRFYGMLHLSAKRHRFIVWWERRPMKDVLGNHLKERLFHLVHWLSVTLSLRRISHESINLERKSCLDCSSDTLCTRGEFGRVTYWSQTLRSWRRWTHRKSTRKDSMRKKWCFPNKENLFFQSQMDESKPLEEIRTWEHPPWYGIDQFKERVIPTFLENQKGLFHNFMTHFRLPVKRLMIFWSMSGNFIYRHHVEPRVKLYSLREESFPIPLKYSDVSRTTHTNLDVKQEKRIDDYWNIDGSRDLSDPWTGSHSIYSIGRKSSWRTYVVRREIDEKKAYIQARSSMARALEINGKARQAESEEKIHLENARKLRGIHFIDLEDTEFKETIKNAREKLETSVAPAMPSKIMKSGASNKIQTNFCVYSESWWIYENAYGKLSTKSKTILQEKETIHHSTTIWFIKFIPMPQAMKIPAAKAAVDKEWEKLEKISAWNLTKVKSKKEVIDEARTSGATVHFASLMDICHLKNAELEAKHQKYKGPVVLRGDIAKDNSGSYAVFIEQGSSASRMTAVKIMYTISRLPGCDGQAADAVSAYTQVKMEDADKLLKIPKSECPDIWIRLPRHKWPKSWSSMEDPVVLLERNLYGHPLAGLLWERQFEKILLKHGWEKIPNWECLFVHREKGLFLSVFVNDIKIGWKEAKSWSDVESAQ